MEIIRSKDNKKIKEARKLLTRKGRKQSGHYLIEGFHLLEEALKSGEKIIQIFALEDKFEKMDQLKGEVHFVTEEVLKSLSDTENPQGVVAELEKKVMTDFPVLSAGKYLLLEDVQDPGNVGTMIRTADAAGYDGIFTTRETADVYSPKVMRSMQGSHFHLPVYDNLEAEDLFNFLHQSKIELLVTTLSDQSISHKKAQVSENFALVMGNEGSGVSELATKSADQLIHIEMAGQAESLNVAVAAGILMFSL